MKRSIAFAGVLALLTLAGSWPARSAAAGNDRQQITALYAAFTAAFERKDLDGVMAPYVHDNSLFVFDVTPPREYVGWASYRADYKAFFALFKGPLREKLSEVSITVSGDVAYTHVVAELSGALSGGGTFDAVVRVTDVLRKIGGRWLIVQEHLSVPVDLATGKADLRSKR
jgi:ketosteroid isomerase-like protein